MKHVVVGGGGFLGRHLIDALHHRGEEVAIVDNAPLVGSKFLESQYIECDISNVCQMNDITFHQDSVIYHLAAKQYHLGAPSRRRRKDYFNQVNFCGTRNVLDMARRSNITRIVYFSTDMVYGYPQRIPIKETHERAPLGEYGKSKLLAEDLCQKFNDSQFGSVSVFRPRLISGPGRLGIFEKLFHLIKLNLPVPMIGSGTNCYQMVSVLDCVEAILLAVDKGVPHGYFNLGSFDPPDVRTLIQTLIDKVNSKSVVLRTPAKQLKMVLDILDRLSLPLLYPEQYLIADRNCLLDTSATQKVLGWRPAFSDIDMIISAYNAYENN